ncbi:D-alanyl-D-alanine carboxypeptidase [Mycolicibacterium aromaticivorans JS19b1 = JCM 16368]|uniref:D-alanyl-D-alanine carboxypeptidase n=1 Tax=Mycolicibacterium aromaticivorans JS19b1 = JCM 16368 TaxID=1440774 RepID=A0A064CEC7_9MYCO|nr:D-alanyl-D-alanine carboxypeptidase family protein [Mycolicibacterium aromaticivorans]KDE98041.1 D-alanyl-D-alanine carboxypeptidase [Mycolicibacterium aromaticivorans JS19b1 = JCM 16368]
MPGRPFVAMLGIAMSLALVAPAAAAPTPQPAGAVTAPPDGPARAWLVADLDTGQILGSREPYSAHAPASTIKPLLAMVVLDQLAPNAAIRATAANTQVECSCVGLVPGQMYTARQLLDGLLLVSGNDAANLLADMLGGQLAAVQKMNAKAYQLGARSTRAGSPSGLDGPGWESVTTPHDLALIYREALRYPLFVQIVHQTSAQFPDRSGYREIKNQDRLLRSYAGFIGGKSGYTDLARETYVGMAQRGGHRLIVVEMYGDDDLWNQAAQLLDWGFSHYPGVS